MSDYTDMIKADAYVGFSYEITDTSGSQTFGPSAVTVNGPKDYGEDPWPFNSLYIVASTNPGTPAVVKTILYFTNVGHLLPMEWSIERKEYDNATATLQNTDYHTLTLTSSATFTCETSLTDGYAQFTATFKSPV